MGTSEAEHSSSRYEKAGIGSMSGWSEKLDCDNACWLIT